MLHAWCMHMLGGALSAWELAWCIGSAWWHAWGVYGDCMNRGAQSVWGMHGVCVLHRGAWSAWGVCGACMVLREYSVWGMHSAGMVHRGDQSASGM